MSEVKRFTLRVHGLGDSKPVLISGATIGGKAAPCRDEGEAESGDAPDEIAVANTVEHVAAH
jgi:hypothetical protein